MFQVRFDLARHYNLRAPYRHLGSSSRPERLRSSSQFLANLSSCCEADGTPVYTSERSPLETDFGKESLFSSSDFCTASSVISSLASSSSAPT